jgi:hypothetical protein
VLVNAIQHTPLRSEKTGSTDDNAADVENLAKKMWGFLTSVRKYSAVIPLNSTSCSLSLKVFSNPSGDMWKANIKDIQGEVLCVSQFTLMANTSKGNKPDFHRAMVRISLFAGRQSPLRSPASSPQTNHGRCTPPFYSSWALNTLRGRSRVNGSCRERGRSLKLTDRWEIWSHDER